jgi:DNA segregation ATPase FtsK/SpoIIIE, S-DNA-T family
LWYIYLKRCEKLARKRVPVQQPLRPLRYKRRSGINDNSHIRQDIIGILLIAFALFIFISTSSSSSGLMGLYLVKKFLKPAIGIGVYFLPYFIAFFGVLFMLRQQSLLLTVQLFGVALMFFTMISYGDGGVTAYVIRGGLESVFGQLGAFVALSTLMIISMIMIFNLPLTKALYAFSDFVFKKRPKKARSASPVKFELPKFELPKKAVPSVAPAIKELAEANQKLKEEFKKNEMQQKKFTVAVASNSSTKKIDKYVLPPLSLLEMPTEKDRKMADKMKESIDIRKRALEETLRSFGIEAQVINVTQGPAVTRFEVQPDSGVKVSKIKALENDIALNLASGGIRIEAPIPGKAAVGIEVPNPTIMTVKLGEIARTDEFIKSPSKLLIGLGKDLSGSSIYCDLGKMPHLLVAGTTGSGKSVCINTIISSILMRARPDEVKMIMIDPKMVEFTHYNGIPHLLAPVVTDARKASRTLKEWAVREMERRYQVFSQNGARNLEAYNEKAERTGKFEKMPYILILIDELADMMMVAANEVETTICRIAQKARATGIHLILATQRPSVDVITGLIKANIPSRISFAVATQIDSRVILDESGAEKLLGRGDMLYHPLGAMKPFRLQGAFVSDREVEDITEFIRNQAEPQYNEEIMAIEASESMTGGASGIGGDRDDLFAQAVKIVVTGGQASTSHLQRRLKIGYNRAARIMDEIEAAGLVGPLENDNKPRRIIANAETLKTLGIQ